MTHALNSNRRRRAGFSLVELLISVGILALLTGLILAGVIRARKIATETRVKDDLALIGTALNAYKLDFGDYPRLADPLTDLNASQLGTTQAKGGSTWLDNTPYRGAVLLCRAMIGPDNAIGTTALPYAFDGADGPGFRLRTNGIVATGKVYGPYIDAGKFKVGHVVIKGVVDNNCPLILDSNGNPILYYPAAPGNSQKNLDIVDLSTFPSTPPALPRFNAFDNEGPKSLTPKDADHPNDWLNTKDFEVLAANCGTPDYLLWTAGIDGTFGIVNAAYGIDANGNPTAISGKTDDIANFDLPANLKK